MKKLKTIVTALSLLTAIIVLSYCSPDTDVKPNEKTIAEEITIQSKYLFDFNTKYIAFIQALDASDEGFMKEYIAAEDKKTLAAKTKLEAKCQCGRCQSSCSASGQFSECCICWDPKTHTGACGVYFGIASCKNEPLSPRTRIAQISGKMKFYPIRFVKMLDALEKRGVQVTSIRAELETLISFAE